MAVPTANELYEFLTKFTDRFPGHLWTPGSLVDAARREYKSTTPAIEKRMAELLRSKALVAVRVGHDGLIYWPDRRENELPSLTYLDPYKDNVYDPLRHGSVVTHDDRSNRSNLWANGERDFYILDKAHEALLDELRAVHQQDLADRKAARYQEKLEIKAALEAAAPQGDGLDLLNGLAKMFTHPTRVHTYMHTSMSRPEDPAELHITVSVDHSNLAAFLEVLRNGVPKAEQTATVVELPVQRNGGDS